MLLVSDAVIPVKSQHLKDCYGKLSLNFRLLMLHCLRVPKLKLYRKNKVIISQRDCVNRFFLVLLPKFLPSKYNFNFKKFPAVSSRSYLDKKARVKSTSSINVFMLFSLQ